jgi:outer membrane immunogenic protein
MKKALLALLFILSSMTIAKAQQPFRVGAFAGYGTKIKKPAIGILGEIGIMDKLTVAPSFAYYFIEKNSFAKSSFFEFNANANYYFITEGSFHVYGLAGLQVARSSVSMNLGGIGFGNFGGSATKVGLNVGGGANMDLGSKIMPFAELKYTLGGAEQLGIFAGVKYSIK